MGLIHRNRIDGLTWVKCALESELKEMYPLALDIVKKVIEEEGIEIKEDIQALDHHRGE